MAENRKKPEEQNAQKTKDKINELVEAWIAKNSAEFTFVGIFGKRKLGYRPQVLARCKQYDNAPDEYLNTMLKTLPELIKWYFNIFQAVFIAGLVGSLAAAFVAAYSNVLKWASKITIMPSSLDNFLYLTKIYYLNWIPWALPAIFIAITLFLVFKSNKKAGSSWLSYMIQHWFKIVHNLNELKIEMYYISKVLEIRTNLESRALPAEGTKINRSA